MAPYDSSMKTLAITVDLCLVLHERARTVAGGVELFFLLSFLSFHSGVFLSPTVVPPPLTIFAHGEGRLHHHVVSRPHP